MEYKNMYERLISLLDLQKANYSLIDHAPEGRTEIVSGFRGNNLCEAAKCMIVMIKKGKKETHYVLAVVPGDASINLDALKAMYDGSYASFASPNIAEKLAGSLMGTVLPFTFNTELELLVDPTLLQNEYIYFNAARLDRSIKLFVKDYLKIGHPKTANIAKSSSEDVKPVAKQDVLNQLRHSCAHLLAAAIMELYPHAKRTIGPAIDDGFYYDFDFGEIKINEADFPKIEEKMRSIIKTWDSFERIEVTPEEAKKAYADNEYKIELIEEFSTEGQKLTFYQSGNYTDLCRGGHVDYPKSNIKHFKLLSVAGAYWRGSEKNKMLTRIYGTCFKTKDELDAYLWQLEEAKKRDHRKLGKELELFFIDEMVGKGLVLWLPKGTIIRDQIEALARKKEEEAGYVRVVTPHIAREELYIRSGHLPYYKDSMYPPMKMDDGTYYMKAMNCPHHHRIFQHRPRSYKEMPLRLAEYGTCYRNELSGTLAGLLRVRALAMNDAHIYLRRDQVKEEFKSVIELTTSYFNIFGLKNYWFRLSKWDPNHKEKYFDEPESWKYTEQVLREVLTELKVPFVEADNEAAFYGPKVDVQFKSIIGREETMSTIQLDFVAKKRFGLTYVDSSGKENNDIFVIHRAPLSTHERFLAFLLEHYAGLFPLWMSPVQVSLIPISERHAEYAHKIAGALKSEAIRVEVADEAESMQHKIRTATLQKVPYMGIIGDKEISNIKNQSSKIEDLIVSVRKRDGKDLGQVNLFQFLKILKSEIENKH